MLSRLVWGVFIAVVAFIVLSILVAVVATVPFIAGIISPFIVVLSILAGILAFFGATPGVWTSFRNKLQ